MIRATLRNARGGRSCNGTLPDRGRRRAARAWGNLVAAGAPGGAGVTVAVLDTGVAYPQQASRPASPDLSPSRFVPGYDFVDDDDDPYDENGHGTHVASTIAEETDNGYGVTGLAYGVRIMPVRVLDRNGDGDATRSRGACGTRRSTGRR